MGHRRLSLLFTAGIIVCFTACAEESWEAEPFHEAVATLGCGNDVVEGFEECDGFSDSSCPGACSAQCACPALAPRSNLEVHMMDVGQGDGLVVVSPDGFVMLVDAGNDGNQTTINNYLASIGVTSVDYATVSHMHADHLGSMDHLLNAYPEIVASFDNGNTAGTIQYSEYSSAAGARRVTVNPGDTIDMGPSVQVDVLHADANASGENDNSVVLRITHGSQTFLLGGDCESGCESGFDPGQIDVYKAHHHGSRTSSSDLLLSRMAPTDTAIVSMSAGNSYGHPHQEAMDRLTSYGIAIYRTDLDGPLAVYSDGVSHAVNEALSCSHGATRSCGVSSVGACQMGTQTCNAGVWSSCVGDVGPSAEQCSNGVDDDCDGSTDAADCGDCGSCLGHMLISQVAYDTPGTDSVEEYVDLYNPTAGSIDLGGWTLSDNSGSWTIPVGTTIGAGAYLTIARQTAGFSSWHGFDPDVAGMSISLNNGGDKLDLKDDGGALVDHVAWEGFEAGWSITAAVGAAIERANLDVDTDTVSDWAVISPASPRGGPSLCASDAECDNGVYCDGAETCDPVFGCVAGTPVTCNDGVSCTLDSCDEAADACVVAADDGACDDGLFCNGVETCDIGGGCVTGSDPCGGSPCDEATDTCLAAADRVVISQVHYDTPGTDSVEEFVDLYNPTGAAVRLDGWTLSDNIGSWTIPNGTTIAASAYLSIARDSNGFSALYGTSPDVTGMTLSLNNTGDVLTLRNASAQTIDHVAWEGFQAGWNITASVGSSLERIDAAADTDSDADWTTTTPATPRGGGGPGAFVELFNDDFEAGWGPYRDGGSDVRRSANDSAYAHQGTYCVRIRDNSGTASAFYSTNGFDLSAYSELQIDFWYIANSMETGEDFFVEFYDGSTWHIVAAFARGTDFNNGSFYNPSVSIDSGSYNFGSNSKLRFRADASSNADYVYIDEIVVSAR